MFPFQLTLTTSHTDLLRPLLSPDNQMYLHFFKVMEEKVCFKAQISSSSQIPDLIICSLLDLHLWHNQNGDLCVPVAGLGWICGGKVQSGFGEDSGANSGAWVKVCILIFQICGFIGIIRNTFEYFQMPLNIFIHLCIFSITFEYFQTPLNIFKYLWILSILLLD